MAKIKTDPGRQQMVGPEEIKKIFAPFNTPKRILGYLYHYHDAFKNMRNDVKSFFEIGANEGESLRAFREYFPNAKIVGAEIRGNQRFTVKNNERLTIEIGDATNPDFVNKIITKHGNFDILLDDGSHQSKDMRKAFELWWPHVNICYCIEDLHTQIQKHHLKQFVGDDKPMFNSLFSFVRQIQKDERPDIFKITFYRWFVCIWKNKTGYPS